MFHVYVEAPPLANTPASGSQKAAQLSQRLLRLLSAEGNSTM